MLALSLLTMNMILLSLDNMGIKVVANADDVTISISGKNPGKYPGVLQRVLLTMAKWARENGNYF